MCFHKGWHLSCCATVKSAPVQLVHGRLPTRPPEHGRRTVDPHKKVGGTGSMPEGPRVGWVLGEGAVSPVLTR